MISFDVSVNGNQLCVAGMKEPCVLTAILTSVVRQQGQLPCERELKLEVGGLKDDDHFSWPGAEIRPGDTITLRVIDTQEADPPQSVMKGSRALAEREERAYYERLKKRYGDQTG